jgi:hypothetical protein
MQRMQTALQTQAPPHLEHIYSAEVELGTPLDLGTTSRGYRLIVPILGGHLEGPDIKARICPSYDWIIVRPDNVSELDVRVTVETEDGAHIYVTLRGYLTNQTEVIARAARGETVPPDEYYFCLAPTYETSDPRYTWLQSVVVVGPALFYGNRVTYDAWAVR